MAVGMTVLVVMATGMLVAWMLVPTGMLMALRVLMPMGLIMVVVVLFMFHPVRIPSVLECLHAPQRWEKNARP